MRLTCPNCGAQYQVRDDLIPEDGRDVQCSNCGNTWFFSADDPQEDDTLFTGLESDAFAAQDADPEPEAGLSSPDVADDDADTADFGDGSADAVDQDDSPKPSLSDEAADVLRQEAAREAAKRIEDRAPLETQTEMGLEATLPSNPPPVSNAADEPGTSEASPASVAAAAVGAVIDRETRADLLPDIEEINSTLRATTERTDLDPPSSAEIELLRQRRGFRFGFGLIVLLIAGMMMLYVRAADVIAAVPALEPQVNAYVEIVTDWRIGLDQAVNALLRRLENLGA